MKRQLLILTALFFLLGTFHSCMQVNIGARIREGGERRLGVDVRQPRGGVMYRLATAKGEEDRFFVRAAEVSYSPQSPWVVGKGSPLASLLGLPLRHEAARAVGVRPTGRVLLVECRRGWSGKVGIGQGEEDERGCELQPVALLDTLPAGAKTEPAPQANGSPANSRNLGSFGKVQEAGAGRRLVAAPFDYLIDPVLGGAASTVDCLFSALFMLYWIPNTLITGDAHPPI